MPLDFTTREGRREQGKLIQQVAEEAGLSLEVLAREIGCSRALIYQYVSGATLAQPDRIQQIAERTGRPLAYFYGGDAAPDHLQDRIAGLQILLTAQTSPADLAGAISTCEQLVALTRQSGDGRAEALIRLRFAGILLHAGDAGRALTALEQVQPLLRQLNMAAQWLAAEQSRGHALLDLGRTDEAEICFMQVAEGGVWQARWQGLVSLAAVAEMRGDYHGALAHLDGAARLLDTAPDLAAARTLQLYVAGNLANIHLASGDIVEAVGHAERAQELAVQIANQDQYLESMLTLGVCQRWQGALAQSRLTLDNAARWTRLLQDRGREAVAVAELAQTLVELGRYDEARACGKDALQLAIAHSVRRAELCAQLALAQSYLRAGLVQDARYHAAQALEISQHVGQAYAQADALIVHADTRRALGDLPAAQQDLARARALADRIGARLLTVRAMTDQVALGDVSGIDELTLLAHSLALPVLFWPAATACGGALVAAGACDQAEEYFRDAIATLAAIRRPLALEPEGDTYLEHRAAWRPYQHCAALLRGRGDQEGAARVVAEAEWPPLVSAEGDTSSCV